MVVRRGKHPKRLQRTRRTHLALAAPMFVSCPRCGTATLPHRVCQNCGTYKGEEVIDVLAKLEKKERKQKEKELEAAKAGQQTSRPLDAATMSAPKEKKAQARAEKKKTGKTFGHANLHPGDTTGAHPKDAK